MNPRLKIADEADTFPPRQSLRPQFRLLDEADTLAQLENLRSECLALGQPLPKDTGDSVADLDRAEAHATRARITARLPQRSAAQKPAGAMSQTAKCQDAHAGAVKPATPPPAAPKPPAAPAAAPAIAAKPSQTEQCRQARLSAKTPKLAAPISPPNAETELIDACLDYSRRSKIVHDARIAAEIAALAKVMRAP